MQYQRKNRFANISYGNNLLAMTYTPAAVSVGSTSTTSTILSLTPNSGIPGTPITISGFNFVSNAVTITQPFLQGPIVYFTAQGSNGAFDGETFVGFVTSTNNNGTELTVLQPPNVFGPLNISYQYISPSGESSNFSNYLSGYTGMTPSNYETYTSLSPSSISYASLSTNYPLSIIFIGTNFPQYISNPPNIIISFSYWTGILTPTGISVSNDGTTIIATFLFTQEQLINIGNYLIGSTFYPNIYFSGVYGCQNAAFYPYPYFNGGILLTN